VRSLNYVPELTINTTRQKFYKTPFFLSTRSIIGKRSEQYGTKVTDRSIFDSTWKLDSARLKFSKNTSFNINSSYQFKRTNEDEKQSVLNGGATYTIKMGNSLNGNIRYSTTRSYGISPFKSNTVTDQSKLNMNFTYSKKKNKYDKAELRSNLFQAYYDMDKNRFSSVSNDITWTWRKSSKHYWRLYLRGNYDFDDTILKRLFGGYGKLKSVYIKYDLKDSDNFNLNLSTTYDRILKKYKTLNGKTTFRLNPFWKINTDVIFDLQKHKLRTVNYIFERDLHCFFMKFTARVKQKEYYMEFGLKAFPGDKQKFAKSKETGKWKREKNEGKFF
jgi:mRNA-degrading endonuclease HigB of HigAB toxin-antitoxin module